MTRADKLSPLISLIERHSPGIARELSLMREGGVRIEEVRIRSAGRSFVRANGEERELTERFFGSIDGLLSDISGGSPFSQRSSLSDGYVTTDFGVRVGVAGVARYDEGRIGIGEISALVFRVPAAECAFARRMYREWRQSCGSTLIVSPPGEGKSTALFSLVSRIAEGGLRTVLVDERCECDLDALREAGVDVMRGYRRCDGIEIAVRTLSPSVVACDEIYRREDADAILSAFGSGVTVIASAHARGSEDIKRRPVLSGLVGRGVFSTLFSVAREKEGFSFRKEELPCVLSE